MDHLSPLPVATAPLAGVKPAPARTAAGESFDTVMAGLMAATWVPVPPAPGAGLPDMAASPDAPTPETAGTPAAAEPPHGEAPVDADVAILPADPVGHARLADDPRDMRDAGDATDPGSAAEDGGGRPEAFPALRPVQTMLAQREPAPLAWSDPEAAAHPSVAFDAPDAPAARVPLADLAQQGASGPAPVAVTALAQRPDREAATPDPRAVLQTAAPRLDQAGGASGADAARSDTLPAPVSRVLRSDPGMRPDGRLADVQPPGWPRGDRGMPDRVPPVSMPRPPSLPGSGVAADAGWQGVHPAMPDHPRIAVARRDPLVVAPLQTGPDQAGLPRDGLDTRAAVVLPQSVSAPAVAAQPWETRVAPRQDQTTPAVPASPLMPAHRTVQMPDPAQMSRSLPMSPSVQTPQVTSTVVPAAAPVSAPLPSLGQLPVRDPTAGQLEQITRTPQPRGDFGGTFGRAPVEKGLSASGAVSAATETAKPSVAQVTAPATLTQRARPQIVAMPARDPAPARVVPLRDTDGIRAVVPPAPEMPGLALPDPSATALRDAPGLHPAPRQTATVPLPAALRAVVDAVPGQPDRTIEITLAPQELGRVRMRLSLGEGTAVLFVIAERVETQDLIRRHVDQLMQEFRAQGFDGVNVALGDGRGRNPAVVPQADGRGDHAVASDADAVAGAADVPAPVTPSVGGLDLRL